MSDTEICYAGIADLAEGYGRGELSPVEVTRAYLARIEALDPKLHSYITVLSEQALEQAERAEREIGRGEVRGPLHGVPLALKDLCFTKGVPTTAGMRIRRDFRPDFDATAVTRLEAAGAVLLGKLSLTEAAMVENLPEFPTPVNPWHPDYWAGASSNGSGVATAAGLCAASLGSDTGGSIRFPSAMNGVTGIKPTWGRVSVHGVFALAPTLDHLGPMARSAEDAGHLLQAIAGPDPADPMCLRAPVPDYIEPEPTLSGVRIGLASKGVLDVIEDPVTGVVQDVAATLEKLGAHLVDLPLPDLESLASGWGAHCSAEAAVVHADTFPSRADEYGDFMRGFLEVGRSLPGTEVARLEAERRRFSGEMAAVFEAVDLVLVPVCWRGGLNFDRFSEAVATQEGMTAVARFTAPFDFSGHPTITLPGGFEEEGVPIGFQLVAPYLGEAALVSAGRAFQSATDHHLRRPPI